MLPSPKKSQKYNPKANAYEALITFSLPDSVVKIYLGYNFWDIFSAAAAYHFIKKKP